MKIKLATYFPRLAALSAVNTFILLLAGALACTPQDPGQRYHGDRA